MITLKYLVLGSTYLGFRIGVFIGLADEPGGVCHCWVSFSVVRADSISKPPGGEDLRARDYVPVA